MVKKRISIWVILGVAGVGICLLVLWISGKLNWKSRNADIQPTNPAANEAALPLETGASSGTIENALGAISSLRMFATITDLTSIQPHSGWRGSATTGEKEAINYLQVRLDALSWLKERGMTQEREEFNVFLGTEDHTSSVFLTGPDGEMEIPADAIRGNRDDPLLALNMDSDRNLSDSELNPIRVEGSVTLIPDNEELSVLIGSDQSRNILMVDFSIVDVNDSLSRTRAEELLGLKPAAIVVVTRFSNLQGVAHGSFIGDKGGILQSLDWKTSIPILFIEMENLKVLGISEWDDLESISQARVEWDSDVTNPAISGNLIVHIPGENPEHPIILSAHIDSAHSPGALDDGSGSAILLEIATVLDELQIQPPNDLYLVWYGSEEIGLYGSTYFTTTHSDLLNRVQANIQVDCLTRPVEGLPVELTLMFSRLSTGNITSDPFASYLMKLGEQLEIPLSTTYWPFASDNGSLSAFNIPNVNLIYESPELNDYPGGVWVAGHLHDPYDTVKLVREMEDEQIAMTRFVLAAALTPSSQTGFVDHNSDRLAVFIASHTESPHMTPSGLSNFSLALIKAGYAINVIPYGSPVTDEALSGADLVVILPVHDYPIPGVSNVAYDTSWIAEEIAVVDRYVRAGGRVLVTNSANRLKFYNSVLDKNEDWPDLNALTEGWGIKFTTVGASSAVLETAGEGLMEGVSEIVLTPTNAVGFTITDGRVLAGSKDRAYLAQVDVGEGEVIICSDLTMLGDYDISVLNPLLVNRLADWK